MNIIRLQDSLSRYNTNLLIGDDVVLTSDIDVVIAKCDKYFKHFNRTRYVSSGYRGPDHQLQLIINYAKMYDIPVDFTKDDYARIGDDGHYVWKVVWSKLLSLHFPKTGILINPPMQASCLYDYYNPNKGVMTAGTVLEASTHQTGKAFDTGGKNEKGVEDLPSVIEVYDYAKAEDEDLGIVGSLVERAQDCYHNNVGV